MKLWLYAFLLMHSLMFAMETDQSKLNNNNILSNKKPPRISTEALGKKVVIHGIASLVLNNRYMTTENYPEYKDSMDRFLKNYREYKKREDETNKK